MNSSAIPEGPGSVFGAPKLPEGFTGTFTSRYVNTGGLRQHVVTGGDGPTLLLVHGWPQTWYAWRLVMPALARDFHVVVPDQRGCGLSGRPEGGYDTGTLASDLVALMDALGHEWFAVAGHDTGMWIGYALAADHPGRVARLAVAETPLPGVSPSPPLFASAHLNNAVWHFAFNRLAAVNDELVTGREEVYFGWQFATKAARPLRGYAVRHYIDTLAADPAALHASFAMTPPKPVRAALPRGSGSFAVIRALIRFAEGEEEEPAVAALAAQAGVSQPRVSQVLTRLRDHYLVERVDRGRWRPHREALLDRFMAEYRGPGGSEQFFYALDSPADVAVRAARSLGYLVAVSADVGPDLIVPWRRPSTVILYVKRVPDMAALELVDAQGRHGANVIVRMPADQSVFPVPALVAELHGAEIGLADPSQMLWDLDNLGGADRAEAAGRLREWLLASR